jgi:hypothetical protein
MDDEVKLQHGLLRGAGFGDGESEPDAAPPENRSAGDVVAAIVDGQRLRDACGRFLPETVTAAYRGVGRSRLEDQALAPLADAQAARWLDEHGLRRRNDLTPEHAHLPVASIEIETAVAAWAQVSTKRDAQFIRMNGDPMTTTTKQKAVSLAHDSSVDREGRALDRLRALFEQQRATADPRAAFFGGSPAGSALPRGDDQRVADIDRLAADRRLHARQQPPAITDPGTRLRSLPNRHEVYLMAMDRTGTTRPATPSTTDRRTPPEMSPSTRDVAAPGDTRGTSAEPGSIPGVGR